MAESGLIAPPTATSAQTSRSISSSSHRVEHALAAMTLHDGELKAEVGVRELHDHLSRYVQHVKDGAEVVVTMRGRRVARLVPVDQRDALADLRARGLVREPTAARRRRPRARIAVSGSVSDLIADQRR